MRFHHLENNLHIIEIQSWNTQKMKTIQSQGQYKSGIKKHKRVKSQELMNKNQSFSQLRMANVSMNSTNSGNNRNRKRMKQQEYSIQVIRPDGQNFKLIISNDQEMSKVKDSICKKMHIDHKSIYFHSVDEDINFDYRFQEGIGMFDCSKIVAYSKIMIQPDQKGSYVEPTQLSQYFIYDCLSVGGFSKVFLIRSKKSGKFYAAKFVDKNFDSSTKFRDLIYNQKLINQLLDYPMLVKMHQFIQTKQFYIFILDYCPSGQLFCLMKGHRDMTQNQAKFYFLETILGVEHMHEKSIIYRDIKPENILLDKTGHVKIADFGLAKIMRQKSMSYCGSLQYMAPQIVLGSQHSFGVDHYCLGSLLFELMVGCPPFYNPNFTPSQTKYHIINSQVKFPSRRVFSVQLIDFVSKLLDKNPKTRLGSLGGIKQILTHPWVGKFDRQKYQKHLIQPPFNASLNQSNFETTYLPKDSIQQTKKRIKMQIEQSNKENGFKKQKKSYNQFSDKQIYRNRLKSSQIYHKSPNSNVQNRNIESNNPYSAYLLKQNRSSKKLSVSSAKNFAKIQSKSLHNVANLKSGQCSNKNRSMTKNFKDNCLQNKNSLKNIFSGWKGKQRQQKQNRKNTENTQEIKRSHNTTLYRKSSNFEKQNGFKIKFETKNKGSRRMVGQYIRNSCIQEGKDKGEAKITHKMNRAIVDAFHR